MTDPSTHPPQRFDDRSRQRLPHRVALFLVGLLLLCIVALLPFALAGVVEDVSGGNAPNYLLVGSGQNGAETHVALNLRMTNIDEWNQFVTIEASGNRSCPTGCPWTDRIHFVSIPPAGQKGQGLPPYETLLFPPNQKGVSQEIRLPISGAAIRYPFDHYNLEVAVVVQRVLADGTVQTLIPDSTPGYLSLSATGNVPKAVVGIPTAVDAAKLPVDDPAYRYYAASLLTFSRPLYLQVLSIALVLLVSAAAAYAVFMRPLEELVLGAGAIVLGIWSIRAVLLGPNVPGFTLVDLSLMVVILFLLVALTWRALLFLYERSQVSPLPLRDRSDAEAQRGDVASEGGCS